MSPSFTFFRVIDVPVGVYIERLAARRKAAGGARPPPRIVHVDEIRPYRPLPLFRADTIVQHYMQPEEFRQFFDQAYGGAKSVADKESDDRIAQVYDLFLRYAGSPRMPWARAALKLHPPPSRARAA